MRILRGDLARWSRSLAFLILTGVASAAAADTPRMLLLGNETVRPGVLQEFEQIGEEQGIHVDTGRVEDLEAEPDPDQVHDRDLAIVFAPSHAIANPDHVAALREALADAGTPVVVVHRGQADADGLDDDTARRIAAYLTEGGARNFEHAFAYLDAAVFGRHAEAVPDPVRYPDRGIYHPDYEGLVFESLDDYEAWRGDFGERPVIGIAIHDSHVRHTLTDWIDTTVELIESEGGVAVPFFTPVNDAEGMQPLVAREGEPAIDALLFYRVMLNPDDRREDFASLGVPVLQGLIYRDGSEADWRGDDVGFPRGSTPFYFSMAEMAGATDPTVVAAERSGDQQVVAVRPELDALVQRAFNAVDLQRKPNADKRPGAYIYNYPTGETNFSASNMNVPESLAATLADLADAGYTVDAVDAEHISEAGKRLVGAYYRDADLEALVDDDLAALYPVSAYREWLATRGEALRARVKEEWGEPEAAPTVVEHEGEPHFVVPRLEIGHMAVLPQPPRAMPGDPEREGKYHDTDLPFSHDYLASYAWLHQGHEADALVHFGTHGSAEYGVGKSRGLALEDDPHAVVGELPHVYPYIVDNLAEATIAKRRARATMVSHQTPPFAPAALYHELVDLHDLIHDWEELDDGRTRERVEEQIVEASRELDMHKDLGFGDEELASRFHCYVHAAHDYIHELAQQSEPIGLHTFGRPADDGHLLSTVMQMLGEDYHKATAADPEELFAGDFETAVVESEPYRLLKKHLLDGSPLEDADSDVTQYLEQGRTYLDALRRAGGETEGLIHALDGGFIEPSVGGDPMRNPDSLPTGRNLYGFDPSRVPTRAAYETGAELMEGLIRDHKEEHGEPPERLAFTLWSMEVMRHHGVVEGQVMKALGVEPVWNDRGRLEGYEVIPRDELDRPRVDVVLQASGLYRDAFAGTLELLSRAAAEVAGREEPDNPVHAMTRTLAELLEGTDLDADAVQRLSRTRAFSADIGQYGTGLDGAVADVDAWSEGETLDEDYMGRVFLDRLEHAYGPDPDHWGETVPGINLFERQLGSVDAAVFARSSNVFGLLSSDDPFQYLGGLSLGVQTAGGERPELYISNLRDPVDARMERADQFLSREIRTRYHHPRWLQSMVDEGYSGTTTLQDTVENLWGWQATAPEMVRDDQWDRFFDIYVNDAYELGLEEWFEQHNPEALTRITERMLDAARTGHWTPDEAVLETLVEQHQEWTGEHGETGASEDRDAYVAETAAGFGMNTVAVPDADASGASDPVTVSGSVMEPVAEPEPEAESGAPPWQVLVYIAMLVLLFLAGVVHQALRGRRSSTGSQHRTGAES
ncbi:cobaltochelatase subunit CobN [Thioalkalivibrio sp. AKL10]|uniref:cobaltochelatase subunit CobN n=1 Tax=Thioalkalivibrio sp. AKL10 TaxID=1158158 RepID=UPI002100D115|nr:cobaltochelatase subunit CobN [Thioalkalivibrio sp. AKL10]